MPSFAKFNFRFFQVFKTQKRTALPLPPVPWQKSRPGATWRDFPAFPATSPPFPGAYPFPPHFVAALRMAEALPSCVQ